MNNHSFARGTVYRKPKKISPIIAFFFRNVYYLYLKCCSILKKYILWSINEKKFIIGKDGYIGDKAYFFNDGKKDNILLGDNVVFKGCIKCEYGGRVTIGNDVYVGDDTIISSFSNVSIGNNIAISYGVGIFDNVSHPLNDKRRHEHFCSIMGLIKEKISKDEINYKNIIIEDGVWIGFNAVILKGVTVGKGAVVGACSVVTTDVPPYTVVAGNPAKVVKNIEHLR